MSCPDQAQHIVDCFSYENCPEHGKFVRCDKDCRALEDPQSPDEFERAYKHWRSHGLYHGCSHGR